MGRASGPHPGAGDRAPSRSAPARACKFFRNGDAALRTKSLSARLSLPPFPHGPAPVLQPCIPLHLEFSGPDLLPPAGDWKASCICSWTNPLAKVTRQALNGHQDVAFGERAGCSSFLCSPELMKPCFVPGAFLGNEVQNHTAQSLSGRRWS